MKEKFKYGLALIELVIVVAIIIIFAALIMPRFMRLTNNAQTASTNALASALTAANTSNYTVRSFSTSLGSAVANCTDVGALLKDNLPKDYKITPQAVSVDKTVSCLLTGPNGSTANFTAKGIL